MPTATKSQKAETPFREPVWPWNQPPLAGNPTRQRCQAVVTEAESQTGVELVAFYRAQEKLAADNDIDSRAAVFEKPHAVRGVGAELLRREMANCNHEVYLSAQAALAKLRQEALALVTPIVKRLAKSLADELNDTALVAEERLEKAGLPIRAGGVVWLLHSDPLVTALWSWRGKAEALLASLSPDNAVGAVQFFCTSEQHVPFTWAS